MEKEDFQDIAVHDLTQNAKLVVRLFFLVAYVPNILICLLGLKAWFVST